MEHVRVIEPDRLARALASGNHRSRGPRLNAFSGSSKSSGLIGGMIFSCRNRTVDYRHWHGLFITSAKSPWEVRKIVLRLLKGFSVGPMLSEL